ncbi:M48 family metalloprotease [Dankookia sp. GCM10030260]
MARPARRILLATLALPLLVTCGTPQATQRLSKDPQIHARIAREAGNRPVGGAALLSFDGRDALLPAVLQTEFEPVTSPALQREIQRIANGMLARWTETPLPQLGVFISPVLDYAAYASTERRVFVNLGVLRDAGSEDEIAFVLGHEISHVLLGHNLERRAEAQRSAAASQLAANAALVGTSLAVSGGTAAQLTPGATSGTKRVVIVSVMAGTTLLRGLANELFDPGWARGQETEADRLGFDLAVRAGYSPTGAADSLDNLRRGDGNRAATEANLRGTVQSGIAMLGTGLTQFAPSAYQQYVPLGLTMFGGMIEKMTTSVATSAGLAERHDAALTRRTSMTEYDQKFWNLDDPPDSKPNPFRAGALGREVDQWVAARTAAGEVSTALVDQDTARARGILAQGRVQRLFPATHRMLQAKIYLAEGRIPQATQEYEQATRLPTAPSAAFAEYAAMLAGEGQVDAAMRVLDQGAQRFNNAELFLPTRAGLLARAGRKDAATRVLAQCAAKDRSLLEACEASMKASAG